MSARSDIPTEVEGRWRPEVVLKRDVFSTVERGRFITQTGEVDAALRRIDRVPWWSFPLARHLFRREQRALKRVNALGIAPRLLYAGNRTLVRGFIDGVAMQIAKPHGDRQYFQSARSALRTLHRAGLTHNDLAKQQNWLRGIDGKAYLTDFQLAFIYKRRGKLFRLAAYEDLRHLLKHKRTYLPGALTAKERAVLARKTLPTRVWMATGKRIYRAITRGIFGFVDREGGGPRLVHDAPRIAAALKARAGVLDAAIVAFPDRRAGTGLYVFVEASSRVTEQFLRETIAALPMAAPELVQVVDALPRNAEGAVRTEILQLVAMNQVDLIPTLVTGEAERALVDRLVAGRRNLRDRFSF